MTDWIDVAKEQSFIPGEKLMFDLDDATRVIIVKIEDAIYAIEDSCTHDYLSMEEGEIEGCEIVCPFHGAKFCLKSGEVTAPPAYENIVTFPLQITEGVVQIRDSRWD